MNNSIKNGPLVIAEDSSLFIKMKDCLVDDKAKTSNEQLRMDKLYLLVDLLHLMPKKANEKSTAAVTGNK